MERQSICESPTRPEFPVAERRITPSSSAIRMIQSAGDSVPAPRLHDITKDECCVRVAKRIPAHIPKAEIPAYLSEARARALREALRELQSPL